MEQITHFELLELLRKSSKREKVGLEVHVKAITDSRAEKNRFGMIFKHSEVVAFTGKNYSDTVNTELLSRGMQPQFDSEPLHYGNWLIPHRVIEHLGDYYLRTQTTAEERKQHPVKILRYTNATGRILTPAQVKKYLPKPCNSGTQAEVGLERTAEQVWVRNYKFSNIQSLTINNVTYQII